MSSQSSARQLQCSSCRKSYSDTSFAPFCSERCKMADLGAWMREEYRIKSVEPVEPEILEQALESAEMAVVPKRGRSS